MSYRSSNYEIGLRVVFYIVARQFSFSVCSDKKGKLIFRVIFSYDVSPVQRNIRVTNNDNLNKIHIIATVLWPQGEILCSTGKLSIMDRSEYENVHNLFFIVRPISQRAL